MYKEAFICLLLVCSVAKAANLTKACGDLFELPPNKLSDPLKLPGGCALNTCGTDDGTGYVDIVCNIACKAGLYLSGTCTRLSLNRAGGVCQCNGPSGSALLLSLFGLTPECKVIAACSCASCNLKGGSCKVARGETKLTVECDPSV